MSRRDWVVSLSDRDGNHVILYQYGRLARFADAVESVADRACRATGHRFCNHPLAIRLVRWADRVKRRDIVYRVPITRKALAALWPVMADEIESAPTDTEETSA